MFIKYNTIDLDYCDKETLKRIVYKIKKCKYLLYIEVKDSNYKGYHIKLFCSKDCDLCRLVFDDDKRYFADITNRFPFEQNILWDNKIPRLIRDQYERKSSCIQY